MNKKFFLTILTVLLLTVNVLASDIGYIVRHNGDADFNVISVINELDYSYDVIDDSVIPLTNFSSYKMIIIGDGALANEENITVSQKNSLVLNYRYVSDWGIAYSCGFDSVPGNNYLYGKISIDNLITDGINNTVKLYTQQNNPNIHAYYLNGKANGIQNVVVRVNPSPGDLPYIGMIDIGGQLIDGKGNSNSRIIFYGIYDSAFWTTETRLMLKNSIDWLFKGEDKDGDGYYADADCNDNDALKYQYLPGYRDADLDGIGSGQLLQICSGDDLPLSYLPPDAQHSDCNDSNINLWQYLQGYLDFDQDGIGSGELFQICSGDDLPIGYVLPDVQHDDCNDSDANLWQLISGYRDADDDLVGSGALLQVCSGDDLPLGYLPPDAQHSDCNDNNETIWRLISGYRDADDDLVGSGALLQVCSGDDLPIGYVPPDTQHDDCNDSDANLWRLISGYRDADLDGIGSGQLLQICSGDDLPLGYLPPDAQHSDCNDSNINLWQYLQGYLDFDQDGYGAGNLIQVCSGDELPLGYSVNNQDCNDNNETINPRESEIPYDYTDQNCDGIDLADVDSDGYCKSGYLIQDASLQCPNETLALGTDCNDNDPSTNPWSKDIYKNCRNDAPIITPINKIIVQETDEVIINVHAIDPENDSLSYSINDSRFSKSDNIFQWQTGYEDKRNYIFKIDVRDGINITSSFVQVDVLEKNRPPLCNEIPEIIWNEDSNATIDLKNYCSDSENNNLTYSIYNSSDNDKITVNIIDSTASFYSDLYWWGNDWVIFMVSDGTDYTLTNRVNLSVNHVNHAPIYKRNIENISWDQNSNLLNRIDLNDYFSDVDKEDNLTFDASGNQNINITINDGVVSLYPNEDFYGNEKIIFSATDGNFTAYSNEIELNVLYLNKPPIFGEMNCNNSFSQYQEQNCEINASDAENDSISLSVLTQNNLNCTMEGNVLKYVSMRNYNGTASCIIRANDNYGHRDYELRTYIENINDEPTITAFSPNYNPKLRVNSLQVFRINAIDIDSSDLVINWLIGNESVGNGNYYNFNKLEGRYDLTAVVSDGEFNISHSWDVFVGNIHDFTCSEVDGFLCNDNQICKSDILGVYDTSSCCAIACSDKPPEFKAIKKRCQNLTDNIEIYTRNYSSDRNFVVGNIMNPRIYIVNNLNHDEDFSIDFYLYDLDTNKIIKKSSQAVSINHGITQWIEPQINIPYDADETDNYYIFVNARAGNRNGYCNENYFDVDLSRESHNVDITSSSIEEENVLCGDFINLHVKLENLGTNDEDTLVKAENSELRINEVSDKFKIYKYGGKNLVDKLLLIKIPENAEAGNYSLRIDASYGTNYVTSSQDIILGECKKQEAETQTIENLKIEHVKTNPVIKKASISPVEILLLSTVFTMIIFLIVIYLVGGYAKNKAIKEALNRELMPVKSFSKKRKRKSR